jgi:Domain of unknown function (DUF4326)
VSKAEPYRFQLSRAKGWRMPPNSINVARPSRWGNSFLPTQVGLVFPFNGDDYPIVRLRTAPSLDLCLDLYAVRLRCLMTVDEHFLEPLRGKNLGCWCPLQDKHGNPMPCHADILLRLANEGRRLN